MPLRFDLGPFERLYIGKGVLTNSQGRAYFVLEGDAPVLRAKDFLLPSAAGNSLENLYCCIQQIYLEEAFAKYQGSCLALITKAIEDNSLLCSELKAVECFVSEGAFYKALKRLKNLIRPSAFAVNVGNLRGDARVL